MIKIFIATPMYGGKCYGEFTNSFIKLIQDLEKNNYSYFYRFLYNESLITRARDTLSNEFLKTDCTHLLFLDSDIIFESLDVLKLIAEDKDIIGGCYPKKYLNLEKISECISRGLSIDQATIASSEYVFNVLNGTDHKISNVCEVKDIGTGYLLIKRDVFLKLSKTTPSYKGNVLNLTNEKIYAFFQTSIDPNTNVLLSEDYHFCKSWRDIGGQIFVAPYAKAKHIGMYNFG